ncbi:MAG: histidine phosphatase family protein [Cohnella sp.]|nr:histidine phosphatase family protein [Cohnella sp.]
MFLLCIFLAFPTPPAGAEGVLAQAKPVDTGLLNALRQGGYILYIRHGDTVGEDKPNLDLSDCSTQRNLSDAARKEAVKLGLTLRGLRIPIDTPVLASPLCRARDTAALAFGESNVRTDPVGLDIYRLNGDLSANEQQAALQAVTSALETEPSAGSNTVIVAHSFPAGVALGEIPPLGTVVLKPGGPGNGYEIVGRIGPDEWDKR